MLFSILLSFCLSAFAAEPDPFAGVAEGPAASVPETEGSWRENFGFRRELMSEFAASERARPYSRQSAGFEALKKFSTETATKASLDLQVRLVRRDRFIAVPNDMEGMRREGWKLELHNAYADVYHVAGAVGRANVRAGRFYLPFGLNGQTDTHGTLLQLSNERSFGFERDWQAGLYGELNDRLDYSAYYLVGSGYTPEWRGQSGLAAARLALGNSFSSEHGWEGGLSAVSGERLDELGMRVPTRRAGADARRRLAVPTGLLTATAELGGGRDDADVLSHLAQLEYLHSSRRWGAATQYRRFWKEGAGYDDSAGFELSWYLRNDPAGSSLHWLKALVDRRRAATAERDTIVALQYYRYW
ncbi:MAG: hypothetical protein HY925_10280 [Elusimicrobia bacterium]|nr:hypothetical protein [Elusimicrobiota bacterium]